MIRLRLSSLIYVCCRRAGSGFHREERSNCISLPRWLLLPPQPPLSPDQRQRGHDRSHQHLIQSRVFLAKESVLVLGKLLCGKCPTAMARESSFHVHVCHGTVKLIP